jgi:hypothetical protein
LPSQASAINAAATASAAAIHITAGTPRQPHLRQLGARIGKRDYLGNLSRQSGGDYS